MKLRVYSPFDCASMQGACGARCGGPWDDVCTWGGSCIQGSDCNELWGFAAGWSGVYLEVCLRGIGLD